MKAAELGSSLGGKEMKASVAKAAVCEIDSMMSFIYHSSISTTAGFAVGGAVPTLMFLGGVGSAYKGLFDSSASGRLEAIGMEILVVAARFTLSSKVLPAAGGRRQCSGLFTPTDRSRRVELPLLGVCLLKNTEAA